MNRYDFSESRKCSLRHVVDFTSNANPLGPSNKAKHAVRKDVSRLEAYPDEKARYLKAYLGKVEHVEEDRILFGAGSTHLLDVLLGISKPGVIGVLSPLSVRRKEVLERHGASVRPVSVETGRDFSVPVETLCRHMSEVDMMVLSNPHDLTGAVIPRIDLEFLIGEAARFGKVLVIDEALRDYTDLGSPVRPAADSPSTIILRTFSFYHALAGLRLGYCVGSRQLIRQMEGSRPCLQLNSLAPDAAMASLKDREYRVRTLKFLTQEKSYLGTKLSSLKGVELLDTSCNFLLLRLDLEWGRLYESFLEDRILIDGFTGSDGLAYIRVPVGRHKSNAHFMRALRRITGG